jgi:hypothetical protein
MTHTINTGKSILFNMDSPLSETEVFQDILPLPLLGELSRKAGRADLDR